MDAEFNTEPGVPEIIQNRNKVLICGSRKHESLKKYIFFKNQLGYFVYIIINYMRPGEHFLRSIPFAADAPYQFRSYYMKNSIIKIKLCV